jgi:ER membrane protein SH3
VRAYVVAGGGFLLAVLWFDLMFDVQSLRRGRDDLPAEVRTSIAAYYRRVTTEARPMNRLVAAAMLWTLAAVVIGLVRSEDPSWVWWVSLVLVVTAVAVAAFRTVPHAVRLGTRTDPDRQQDALARAIGRDHLLCLALIAVVLVVQLVFAA